MFLAAPGLFSQNFSASHINATHIRISWQPLSNNSVIWNTGSKASLGYTVYATEISTPQVGIAGETTLLVSHQETEAIIGPLEEDRVYEIQIAASNHLGNGPRSNSICIRMKEGGKMWSGFHALSHYKPFQLALAEKPEIIIFTEIYFIDSFLSMKGFIWLYEKSAWFLIVDLNLHSFVNRIFMGMRTCWMQPRIVFSIRIRKNLLIWSIEANPVWAL